MSEEIDIVLLQPLGWTHQLPAARGMDEPRHVRHMEVRYQSHHNVLRVLFGPAKGARDALLFALRILRLDYV